MKKTYAIGLLAAALLSTTGLYAAGPAQSRTMLVLDASGSMWGQIDGKPKVTIAREAIGSMLDGWKGGELGLMAYGHRRKGDCNDIEVLQAIGPNTSAGIRRQVNSLNPKGMTPITASVRKAAEQLRFTEQKATVILVSDGEETCSADPCALGKELEAMGVDFTAHVVGFDIQKGSKAHAQLQCLAANTGGRYLDAKDAGELNKALRVVAEAPAKPEPPKQPEARIIAPKQVMVHDLFEFKAFGPQFGSKKPGEEESDYHLAMVPAGNKAVVGGFGGFDHTRATAAAGNGIHRMHGPREPGDYELRYVRMHRPTNQWYLLAKEPVKVLPISVRLQVAASYPADTNVEIGYSGPTGNGVMNRLHITRASDPKTSIGTIPIGTAGMTKLKFRTPKEPGEYELVYRNGIYSSVGEHGRTRFRVVPKSP